MIDTAIARGLAQPQSWRRDLMRERVLRKVSGASRAPARQALLVAQLSVTLMLLTAAGLLLRLLARPEQGTGSQLTDTLFLRNGNAAPRRRVISSGHPRNSRVHQLFRRQTCRPGSYCG